MSEFDDDWMHPKMSATYVAPTQAELMAEPYLIVREKLIICSHFGPAPTEWSIWSSHKTEKERDDKLDDLNKERHWSLRAAIRRSLGGWEFQDRICDLEAKLAILKYQKARPAS